MNILIDMNLSPEWITVFEHERWTAKHWASVGNITAPDHEIMSWARDAGFVVFTHDLDFGTLLALTRASGPSVIQVRTEDIMPASLGAIVIAVLKAHEEVIASGALITIDERRARVRVLPI